MSPRAPGGPYEREKSLKGTSPAPRARCCCYCCWRWREAALYRCLHRRRPQWREAALCRCLYRRRRRWRGAALRQVSGTECRGCRCCGVGRRKTPVRLNMFFRSAMSSRARQWLFHCPIPVLDCLTPQHGRRHYWPLPAPAPVAASDCLHRRHRASFLARCGRPARGQAQQAQHIVRPLRGQGQPAGLQALLPSPPGRRAILPSSTLSISLGYPA